MLSSWIKHNAFRRGHLLLSPSLVGSQSWMTVPSVVEGCIRGQPLLPHSICREQAWGHLRANLGFGVFWFIPPLLVSTYLTSTSFIGRIFSGLSGVGLAWVQCGVDDGTHRLEGVRSEKLDRTYPGEKPPSFSVLTHRCCLATRKPTQHLLTMPNILVKIGTPYEGGWSTQFHLPRNYGTIFKPKIFYYLFYYSILNLIYIIKIIQENQIIVNTTSHMEWIIKTWYECRTSITNTTSNIWNCSGFSKKSRQ